MSEYGGAMEPRQGAVVVAVKGPGATFNAWLLRPGCLSWDGKIIRLIYFSVNTSLSYV